MLFTYIDDTSQMTLDWRTAEQQIDLVLIVSIPLEILNDSETALSIGDCCVVVVLLAVLVDREALRSCQHVEEGVSIDESAYLEVECTAWTKLWLYGTWNVDW